MNCVSLGSLPYEQALLFSQHEAFVEFRVDLLRINLEELEKLLHNATESIVTYRGSEKKKRDYFKTAIDCGASYIDLDLHEDKAILEEFLQLSKKSDTKILLSYHNYETTGTASELQAVLAEMQQHQSDVLKIVTNVQNKADMLRLLSLHQDHDPLVVQGMGFWGRQTRIAALLFGSLWSYSQPAGAEPTATGQLLQDELASVLNLFVDLELL